MHERVLRAREHVQHLLLALHVLGLLLLDDVTLVAHLDRVLLVGMDVLGEVNLRINRNSPQVTSTFLSRALRLKRGSTTILLLLRNRRL